MCLIESDLAVHLNVLNFKGTNISSIANMLSFNFMQMKVAEPEELLQCLLNSSEYLINHCEWYWLLLIKEVSDSSYSAFYYCGAAVVIDWKDCFEILGLNIEVGELRLLKARWFNSSMNDDDDDDDDDLSA